MDRSRLTQLALTGAVAAGLSLATFGLVRSSGPSAVEVRLAEPTPLVSAPADGQLKVYIAGAVRRPGVYTVQDGDRVADVLEAAGGPGEDANLLAINLAKRLRDEDAVIVPRLGETVVSTEAGNPLAGSASIVPGPLNLNTAGAAALEALPGIGAVRAARIIDSRTKDGPFRSPADLVARKLVSQSVLDGFKDQVVAE